MATVSRLLTSHFASVMAGMHINDSKAALGSKKDRHENIGRGLIGIGLFKCLMNDTRLDGEPSTQDTVGFLHDCNTTGDQV